MLKVGIVQAAPVFQNLEASLALAVDYIDKAASQGARLIVFGETWLPGYPAWLDYCPGAALWNHEPTKEVFAQLRANSVVVPSRQTEMLAQAAKSHNAVVVMGINERVDAGPGNGTLYNSLLTINADGSIANHRRKLIPTYTERMVWGQGDGANLKAVDTAAGRIGGLICWEHWMPLARQVMHDSGEQIHIAVWPSVHEMHQVASRHYAFEGRCFVIAAGLLMKVGDLPHELGLTEELSRNPDQLVLKGGSSIIGPDGKYLVEPVVDEERIILAELDMAAIDKELMTLDVSGHYQRADLFELTVKLAQ